jgi:predicted methyltransferase
MASSMNALLTDERKRSRTVPESNGLGRNSIQSICQIALLAFLLAGPQVNAEIATQLDSAIKGAHRSEQNRARDRYRHPKETLQFFGLRGDMHVVELWPGNGWYTEILAPVLREHGRLYTAHYGAAGNTYRQKAHEAFVHKLRGRPDVYDRVIVTSLDLPRYRTIAPRESVDLILTFRNVHNWTASGNDATTFRLIFAALKPGGVFGVVEHRAREGTSLTEMRRTGYMTEAYVIGLARNAGFDFLDRSEINANPKDTKDHPNGVWSLPPSLQGDGRDADKYLAIGESDRMTLKFKKPGHALAADDGRQTAHRAGPPSWTSERFAREASTLPTSRRAIVARADARPQIMLQGSPITTKLAARGGRP